MPTPDELRAPIAAARAKLEEAIRSAADNWETTLPGDEWTARQAAEHVIPSEAFFATAVCTACGYPGIEFEQRQLASAEEALAALTAVCELSDGRLKHVTREDLEHKHERMGSVADILRFNAEHLEEHAAQIASASGA